MVYVPIIRSVFCEVEMGHKDFVKSFIHLKPNPEEEQKKQFFDITRMRPEEAKDTISVDDNFEPEEDSNCFSPQS